MSVSQLYYNLVHTSMYARIHVHVYVYIHNYNYIGGWCIHAARDSKRFPVPIPFFMYISASEHAKPIPSSDLRDLEFKNASNLIETHKRTIDK